MSTYAPNRWVTASTNQEDGSGSFGRKAQRKIVVEKLKAMVDTNQEIREEESRNFNLISCPGYPELLSNLVSLNIDRGTTAFVVGDTPFSLPADTTSLSNWGNNTDAAEDNGERGLVTADPYAAIFYPSGKSTDNTGSEIVVPPSHMMLKTIALSDQVSFPWFAPAGTRRGGITNATSVGYVNRTDGEFKVVALNEGQRDAMYEVNMNPITFFNGVGLVNYGQKTLSANSSALDRINVARLVVYLRSQLNRLAKPFVFEPNDKITRDEIKQAVESLLLELVGQRALYDFAVVCDETNNTPTRIDRNELYVDIAIEPVKAIEFIYIPLRLKNTGEIQGSLNA
jgi:phage tail sheath protein FI